MSKLKSIFYECEEPFFHIKTKQELDKEALEEIARKVYKSMTKNHVRIERYKKDNEFYDKLLFSILERLVKVEKENKQLYSKLEQLYYPMNERD